MCKVQEGKVRIETTAMEPASLMFTLTLSDSQGDTDLVQAGWLALPLGGGAFRDAMRQELLITHLVP